MKKHLIAAAVAAAVAAPAMAQDVSIYGRLDAGYSVTDIDGGKKTSEVTFSKMYTSLIGFRGTEDLGGGLKASFVIESAMGGPGSTAAFGDRLLYADIAGGFGAIRIGQDNSLIKSIYDRFDAGGSNNVRGVVDAIAAETKGSGNTELEYDPRVVVARYTSPAINGFQVAGGIIKKTVEEGGKDDVETGSGYELGVNYSAGALQAGLAYRKADFQNLIAYTLSSTNGKDTTYTASTSAQNLEDEIMNLGVSYNFGVATVFGQYMDGERKDKATAANGYEEKFYTVGIQAPVGAVTLFASITDGERKKPTEKLDREGYQLGALYSLSKRTRAYIAHGKDEFNTTTSAKTKTDQTVVGVVHTF